MKWDKLSISDKAKYISLAVQSGVTDIGHIRDTYNSYAGGGETSSKEEYKPKLVSSTITAPIKNYKPPKSDDPEVVSFLANWLNNRRGQLYNNIFASTKLPRYAQNMRTGEYTDPSDLRFLNYLRGINPDRVDTNKLFYTEIENAASAKNLSIPSGVLGEYDRSSRTVKYYDYNDVGTRVHERTHAMEADPQKMVIESIMKGNTFKFKKGPEGGYDPRYSRTHYYYNPSEIYSRLMQFRYNSKISPKTIVNKKFLDSNRKLLEEHSLDIIDDDTLIRLFNEVAYNKNTGYDLEKLEDILTLNNYVNNNITANGGFLNHYGNGTEELQRVNYYDLITGKNYGSNKPLGMVQVNSFDLLTPQAQDLYRQNHPTILDDIVVTPSLKNNKDNAVISDIFNGKYNGKTFEPTEANIRHYLDLLQKDKQIKEGYGAKEWGKIGAVMGATGAGIALGGIYAIPWLSSNVAPYLTANGWLSATLATNTTPAWLTPTSATAIDAILEGSGTAASINNMRENGPTVGNVIETGLGVAGLAYEAAPTIMEGYQAGKRMYNTYRLSKEMNRASKLPSLFQPVSKSIQVQDLTYPGREFYYYDGNNWDMTLLRNELRLGRQDFIDWMNHPEYIKATQANKAEAESMGLSYTPIHEKPSYQEAIIYENFKPRLRQDLTGSQGLVSQGMNPGQMDLNIYNRQSLRPVVKHELAHSSRLAWADGKLLEINPSYKPSQEAKYLRFKNSEVFDDGADFSEMADSKFYDFTKKGFPHEAVTNTRDLGERIGIKVGQEYPGDEKVLEIIDNIIANNPTSLYGQMASHFNRNNLRAVWKALNGTLWVLIPGITSYSILSNSK